MQLRGVAGAGLALALVAMAAKAEPYKGATAHRSGVFWHPAERIWTGDLGGGTCTAAGSRGPAGSAKARTAVHRRGGELIGEIRASEPKASAVLTQARSCGREADAATAAKRDWSFFRQAFAACMQRNDAAQYVGSMTLWIDERCDW